jgi:iron complex outermembrane receptor protein
MTYPLARIDSRACFSDQVCGCKGGYSHKRDFMNKLRSGIGRVGLALFAVYSSPMYAQSTTEEGATNGQLEEILVTAQRRTERIQDVPVSITSVSASQLESAGVSTNAELSDLVPGLKMDRVGNNLDPAIRGISTQITDAGADPNVATYIDGVYQPTSFVNIFDLADTSRIDVAKGPQGTLFGRNATGGAIQIFTLDPTFTTTGQVTAAYGSFQDTVIKGFVSTPLVDDKLAVSLSAFRETADSYYRNLTPAAPLAGIDSDLIRGKALIRPNEDVRVLLIAFYGVHSDPDANYGTPYNGITEAAHYPGSIIPTQPWEVANNRTLEQLTRVAGTSAHGTFETAIGTVNTLLAYNRSNSVNVLSADYAYIPLGGTFYYMPSGPDENEQAEVSLSSKRYGDFSYIAGVNYYHDDNAYDPIQVTAELGPAASYAVSVFARQTSTAIGAFTEWTYDLTNRLTAVVGARYSAEERAVFGILADGTESTNPESSHPFGSKTFVDTTPRAALRYKIDSDTNAYFTYSTGFKSGMYPASEVPSSTTAPGPKYVLPEKVSAYEIGVKTAPQSWYSLNAAAFYYKYIDQQVISYEKVNGIELGVTSNAAASKIYGAELEGVVKPFREFQVRAGISYLHARYSDFPAASVDIPAPGNAGTVSVVRNVTGNQLEGAPDVTATISANYTVGFKPGVATFSANVYHSTQIVYDVGNLYKQPDYTTVGAEISWAPEDTRFTATAYGRNLTDVPVILGTFISNTAAGYSYEPPRNFGVSLSYKF